MGLNDWEQIFEEVECLHQSKQGFYFYIDGSLECELLLMDQDYEFEIGVVSFIRSCLIQTYASSVTKIGNIGSGG